MADDTSQPTPTMVFADADGQIFDHPELQMVGWDGLYWRPLEAHEVAPIPEGSDLFTLPGRLPAGFDAEADEMAVFDEPGMLAVSCFLAPAYLRLLMPAYEKLVDGPTMPLYAYSAVGFLDGELVAPSVRVDPDIRQDPFRFDFGEVQAGVDALMTAHPGNRLVEHLSHCALEYHCRAAQNYFLHRFEAPLPAAPTCNALCVGCISMQATGGDDKAVASHDRIGFAPTPVELSEVALGHIERVGADAVVSFGQGCEGEPLMQGLHLLDTIKTIRAATQTGIINLNSNASKPDVVETLCEAGLDSLRISTNSARAEPYAAYYRPVRYSHDDVRESGRRVKAHGGYVMLNYFVFPGVTDTADEFEALCGWLDEGDIHMVQLRNLNVDPDVYLSTIYGSEPRPEPMGLSVWLQELIERYPDLRLGYFNPPGRLFGESPHPVVVGGAKGRADAHV